MSRFLADLRRPQLEASIQPNPAPPIALFPIGATEQHGPHLPMSVDTIIAEEIAKSLGDEVGEECNLWLLPAASVSKSNEHLDMGAVSLSAPTMDAVLNDIAASVVRLGFKRLVLLNAHGGNTTLLGTALREIRLAHGLMTFLIHPFVPPAYGGTSNEHELGMGIHGGHDETSLMLHLRPDLVELGAAGRAIPEKLASNTHVRFGGSTSFGWTTSDLSSTGHIGDPTGATAEIGASLFAQAVSLLGDQIREISTFSFPYGPDAPTG